MSGGESGLKTAMRVSMRCYFSIWVLWKGMVLYGGGWGWIECCWILVGFLGVGGVVLWRLFFFRHSVVCVFFFRFEDYSEPEDVLAY